VQGQAILIADAGREKFQIPPFGTREVPKSLTNTMLRPTLRKIPQTALPLIGKLQIL
jgi:hypothetical protein